MTSAAFDLRTTIRWVGLLAGPLVALVAYLILPTSFANIDGETIEFTTGGRATVAVMAWMAIWWLSEAVNVSVTALLPLAAFPVLGIADIRQTASPYATDLIFLFMGGFLLAMSMQRWGLDRRIALIALRMVGTRPRNIIAGFMLVTAVMSAFVSNTATTAMMLPIALSVTALVLGRPASETLGTDASQLELPGRNFALCLMLGIAYAASIGGVATIIGTPPNLILVSFIKQQIAEPYRQDISFVRWMMVGVPLAAVFLPVTWLLLTRVLYPVRLAQVEGGHELFARMHRELGRSSLGERVTFFVFIGAASAWIFRPLLAQLSLPLGDAVFHPFAGLTDAGIAMIAAMLLFVIPVRTKDLEFVMDWDTARGLPWGILILFGGGLSLAGAVQLNGVTEFFAAQAAGLDGAPIILIILAVAAAVIFLTELTSNTATAAALIPVLAGLAPGLGMHPFMLIIPAALAASCAFMMPVATPPNAIVFGTGYISIAQMCKAGFWLNIVSTVLITLLAYTLIMPILISSG